MKKTLIIYTHPSKKGHCAMILKQVMANLRLKKKDFEVIDLYRLKYDPILHNEENYATGNRNVTIQNKKFQKRIKAAENLIFIYPNWWNSPPAMLKGWIERVFTGGFAFQYTNGRPIGLLKGRKAAIFITTGAPLVFYQIFEKGIAGKLLQKYVLRFAGITSRVFVVDRATKMNNRQKATINKVVENGMDWLY